MGASVHRDRRGQRGRDAARALRGRDGRRDPRALPHRRVPALRRRAARRGPSRRRSHGRGKFESKRWIYEQYDHLVGSRTVRRPGLDAAVLRLAPSLRGLAVRCRARRFAARRSTPAPRPSSARARNVACAGGQPLGLTDCLNFGNPEKPEVAWELAQAIDGIAAAASALRHPGRLGQRLALQRDRRAPDPADPGRRLCRARARRPPDSRALARGGRRPAGERSGRRPRSAGGGRADPLPLEGRAAPDARARRRKRGPGGGAGRGGRLERAAADVDLPGEPSAAARSSRARRKTSTSSARAGSSGSAR